LTAKVFFTLGYGKDVEKRGYRNVIGYFTSYGLEHGKVPMFFPYVHKGWVVLRSKFEVFSVLIFDQYIPTEHVGGVTNTAKHWSSAGCSSLAQRLHHGLEIHGIDNFLKNTRLRVGFGVLWNQEKKKRRRNERI